MAIIKNAISFGSGFNITAAGPIDSRMRVPKLADLTTVWGTDAPSYAGMIVVVNEEDKAYVLKTAGFDATTGAPIAADPTDIKNWEAVGSGVPIVTNYTAAKEAASSEMFGQLIYVAEDETSTTEVDDEGNAIVYSKGLYVVTGVNEVAKIGTTTASGDIAGDVSTLKGTVSTLANDLDKAETAITDLQQADKDLQQAIDDIVIPVTDVTVNGDTVVDDNGVAKINLEPYAKTTDVENTYLSKTDASSIYATKDSVYTKTDADAAITTAIEKLDVDDTAVDGQYVSAVSEVDGKIVVTRADLPTEAKYSIVKSEESGEYAAVYSLMQDGVKMGVDINIPKDMVVSSGAVVTLADGEVEGQAAGTYIKLVLANAAGTVIYVPVNGLVDAYTGSDYIEVDGYTISVKYDALVGALKTSLADTFDASGAADTALQSAKDYADGKASDAKDAAIADTVEKLKSYYTKDEIDTTLDDYATEQQLTDAINANNVTINDSLDDHENRIDALEGTVGVKATDGVEATGIFKIIEDNEKATSEALTDLDTRVDNLETDSTTNIKTIIVNGVEATVEEHRATIPLVNDLTKDLTEVEKKQGVTSEAVKIRLTDITTEVSKKISIKTVTEVPSDSEADATVIYLEGDAENGYAEKIYIDGVGYHTIGSDLYASKDLASATNDGLMSSTQYTKLDEIGPIEEDDLKGVLV